MLSGVMQSFSDFYMYILIVPGAKNNMENCCNIILVAPVLAATLNLDTITDMSISNMFTLAGMATRS